MDRQAARLVTIGFQGHHLPQDAAEMLRAGVRSVILFAQNFRDASQLRELTRSIRQAAGAPVLVSVDQEGGRVQRFRGEGFPDLPSARRAAAGGEEAVRRSAVTAARCLRAAGIHMNLAPVLDVDSNPANPVIGERAFGSDPDQVASCGVAYAKTLQAEGVAACGKHFPGHGDTSVDSHLDLPHLPHAMERLERVELVPFRAAVGAGIASLMTAHVLFDSIDPQVPATLSRRVVTGLLRERLGFEGLVFTDDFEMQAIADRFEMGDAAVRAIEAGCDQVLMCHRADRQRRAIEALAEAMRSGRLSREQVERSQNRLQFVLDSFVFGLD
jgi:beta-N-acetylhexosaminidase